ncbi:hypothetical protein ES703_113081 [subsurface metagenome]
MYEIGWGTIPIVVGIFFAGLFTGVGYLIGKYWKKK